VASEAAVSGVAVSVAVVSDAAEAGAVASVTVTADMDATSAPAGAGTFARIIERGLIGAIVAHDPN
jgi:hypothetical protein